MANLNEIAPITYEDYVRERRIDITKLNKRQLEILAEQKRRLDEQQRNYGICYYKPQWYQEDFHKSDVKFRLIIGGNQTGKTENTTAEALRLVLGTDPYGKHKRWKGRVAGRVIANGLGAAIGNVLMPKYKKLLPPSEVAHIKNYSKEQVWNTITFKNGNQLQFMSYKQDEGFAESWTGNFVVFDEPPPHEIFIASLRGLMVEGGLMIIGCTPLREPWIYDEVYMKWAQGNPNYQVFCYSLFDNKYVSEKERQMFIDSLSPEEIEARVYGKFKHLVGRVYSEFQVDTHTCTEFEIPADWLKICAMDYHAKKPCAVIWAAVDPHDRVWVYDDMASQGTIEEIAARIIEKEKQHGEPFPRLRYIDTYAATPDRISGMNAQRAFTLCGMNAGHDLAFKGSTKNWEIGKNAVSNLLRTDREGRPMLMIFKRCNNLIESMLKYVWADVNPKEGDQERPRKIYDDFPDALRYALVLQPKWQDPRYFEMMEMPADNKRSITGYQMGG